MGTNCAPLLADLFLYSYEADFMQGLHSQKWGTIYSFVYLRWWRRDVCNFHMVYNFFYRKYHE
jgi:hypothetical protein